MKHEFLLTSKAAVALIAGLSAIAILLIAVGIFIGIGLGMEFGETQTARRSGTAPEKSLPSKPASAATMASAGNGPTATAIAESPRVAANAPAQPSPAAAGLERTTASETLPLQKVFALQVGAFLDLKNAQSLAENLKGRGYAVSLLNSLDARQRLWHAVRVGPANEPGYADLQTASRAAADFIGKEQIQALIRPADSL